MIGSKDSWLAISELDQAQGWMRTADGEKADAALKYTRGKAEQRFLQVLLARFLLLDLLVREAEQLPAGLREKEHRRYGCSCKRSHRYLARDSKAKSSQLSPDSSIILIQTT